jgi:hypothetical protein
MAKRHKLRHQIIEDRLNNSENSWSDVDLLKHDFHTNLTFKNIIKTKSNWNYISQYITWDIIKNNLDIPWNWYMLSVNKNITWDIIINNQDYLWNWEYLSHYKSITWDIIKQNLDLFKEKLHWNVIGFKFDFEILENLGLSVPWNFQNLSRLICYDIINWDIVIKYKDQDWDWDALSDSINLDYNIILENINQPWNWNNISRNLEITSQVLSTNQNLNWNYLNQNKNITEDILLNYPDKPWDWNFSLSSYRNNISKEFILNNPDKPWNYDLLAYKNIIIIDKITDWDLVSENLELPLEFIKENINLFTTKHHWQHLSRNENLNFDFILEHKDKPLDWSAISSSDYITYEIVSKNRNLPWNWRCLTVNINIWNIESEFKLKAREHLAAYKIQQTWFKAYYNPEYLICQNRLYNEFKNLSRVIKCIKI